MLSQEAKKSTVAASEKANAVGEAAEKKAGEIAQRVTNMVAGVDAK